MDARKSRIETIHIIRDDNNAECRVGDTVLLQTKNTNDVVQATIKDIMTNLVVFIIDDQIRGYVPIRTRASDITSITLYQTARPRSS